MFSSKLFYYFVPTGLGSELLRINSQHIINSISFVNNYYLLFTIITTTGTKCILRYSRMKIILSVRKCFRSFVELYSSNYTGCPKKGPRRFKGHFMGLNRVNSIPIFLDSREFFKDCQVLKSLKKALKQSKKSKNGV